MRITPSAEFAICCQSLISRELGLLVASSTDGLHLWTLWWPLGMGVLRQESVERNFADNQ